MSIDKITPEDYEIEEQCDFGTNMTDEEWDKQIDASPLQKQVGGSHYKKYQIQPAEFCFKNKLNNLQSEVISYVMRYKDKNGRQDLEKAMHSIEMLIHYEYKSED
jgi:hypothetical protein